MAPRGSLRRVLTTTGTVAVAIFLVSCESSSPPRPVVVGGLVGFDQAVSVTANGVIPPANPDFACGSSTTTFGTELVETAPTEAKVNNEWGEIVPGAQMRATGTVQHFAFSTGDLPFTHPFGRDVTLDIALDRPFSKLAQLFGTELPAGPLGELHWEITRGLVPHAGSADYLPGFTPQDGDHIATLGTWIIDCGHSDFHTEIHPPTFVAFGRAQGRTTISHAFYNPYRELQLYTPIADQANALENPSRLNDPNTLTFPQYLVQEILRLGHAAPKGPLCCHDQLETHYMLGANTTSPVSWFVCAPPGTKGSSLSVSYGFTVRPGVNLTVTALDDLGCARFDAIISASYTPLDPQRRDCRLSWRVLDQQAQAATGNPDLSVKDAVDKLVPASFLENVNKKPIVDCYGPLVVQAPSEIGHHIETSASQPYPFYGFARVSWTT
jgi:hypothetical protein